MGIGIEYRSIIINYYLYHGIYQRSFDPFMYLITYRVLKNESRLPGHTVAKSQFLQEVLSIFIQQLFGILGIQHISSIE